MSLAQWLQAAEEEEVAPLHQSMVVTVSLFLFVACTAIQRGPSLSRTTAGQGPALLSEIQVCRAAA